jgi:hypothetical protein
MRISSVRRAAVAVTIGAVLVFAGALVAQPGLGPANRPAADECRLADQVLRTGQPAPRLTWATERAVACAELGPAALAYRWRSIGGDPKETGELARASMRVRDGHLYSDLVRIADDNGRPAQVRVAALLVLAKYVNPGNGVALAQLIPPDSIGRIRIANGSTTYTSYAIGAVPMPPGVGPQVLSLMERLAQDRAAQPREVWYAAGMLAMRVRFDLHSSSIH